MKQFDISEDDSTKKINLTIRNYKGFFLSLMVLLFPLCGLVFITYIFFMSYSEVKDYIYIIFAIFIVAVYFLYTNLKGLCFTLWGCHTILYDYQRIIIKSSIFKIIISEQEFYWSEIETIDKFIRNAKSKPGLNEAIGIKPKEKELFLFGHLLKTNEKNTISKELFDFYQKWIKKNSHKNTESST